MKTKKEEGVDIRRYVTGRLLSSEEILLHFAYSEKLEEELFAQGYRLVARHELGQ